MTESILDLLTNACHPGFRTAAVARDQAGRDAMFHLIVDAHGQFLVPDAFHAPKAGIGSAQFSARERHAGAKCDASCCHDCKVPTSCFVVYISHWNARNQRAMSAR